MRDDRVSPLSDHYIMLTRLQQALPLARNNSKLLIFNNIFKIYRHTSIIKWFISRKIGQYILFFLFHIFSMPSYLTCCRGSKLALLHRVKERETRSLSTQASFALCSPKVAWFGKSLIVGHWEINISLFSCLPPQTCQCLKSFFPLFFL